LPKIDRIETIDSKEDKDVIKYKGPINHLKKEILFKQEISQIEEGKEF
jgi:hypothetical protein